MPSRAPDDEFERILEQCRDRLSEISLHLPDLGPAPAPPRILFPETPPPAPPAPVLASAPRIEEPPPTVAATMPEPVPIPIQTEPAPRPRPAIAPHSARTPTPRTAAPQAMNLRWVALAAAAAVLTGAGFWLSRREPPDLLLNFDRVDAFSDVPGSDGVAIASGNTVSILDRDGHVLETRPLDSPVTAISVSGGSVWTANGKSSALVEHRKDGGSSAFAVNHVPVDIDAHEKYLWSTDAKGKQIHQFLITRSMLGMFLQPLDLYDLPDLVVECFDMDYDGVLWLVDAPSRRLYRLKADGAVYKPVDSAPLMPLIGNAGKVKGLAIEDGQLWLLLSPADGKGASVLKRMSLRRLIWTPT